MKRLSILIAIVTLACYTNNKMLRGEPIKFQQTKRIPEDLIPESLSVYDSKEADINLDNILDIIIVCEISDTVENKPVLIYFGQSDGEYQLKGRNDKLAFNGFTGIAVTRNFFTIENRYGTDVTYSTYNHTFKVDNNRILFHRYDDAVYEVLNWEDGPELNSLETIRAEELGYPTFEEYKN